MGLFTPKLDRENLIAMAALKRLELLRDLSLWSRRGQGLEGVAKGRAVRAKLTPKIVTFYVKFKFAIGLLEACFYRKKTIENYYKKEWNRSNPTSDTM